MHRFLLLIPPSVAVFLACSGVSTTANTATEVADFGRAGPTLSQPPTDAQFEWLYDAILPHCPDVVWTDADVRAYTGHFSGSPDEEQLFTVNCGTWRQPEMAYVWTPEGARLSTGTMDTGTDIAAIVDYDGDGRDEVVMTGGGTYQGFTVSAASIHRFGLNGIEDVVDLGVVMQSPDPEEAGCVERFAILRWTGDALVREDQHTPCGGVERTSLGEVPLYRSP